MRVLFEFRHFLTQRTRLRISKIRVHLCKKFDRRDVIVYWVKTAFAQMESKRKAFWFSEGRTKVKRFIGSPRLNKWTFTTCK